MTSEQQIIAAQAAEIERLKNRVASLEEQLYWLRKKMFGKMSEKNLPLDPSVLSEPTLFDEPLTEQERAELDARVKKEEEEEASLIKVRSFERKPRKALDLSGLEVREEHIYPEVENREDYRELEPETTDVLVMVPAMPLPKCMASESILADIILQKFMYHMPFYRVIQKYKELGLRVSDSTMNDWYAATCEKLKLLYDVLRREVMSRDYIQVDESTLPVIDNEKHRAVKGYMWCTRSVEDNMVVFQYDMGSRSHETARKLLRGYRGTIQTDGYGAYDQFESDPHIRVIGCWAHARRKWTEALDEDRRLASEALVYINQLYHIENEAKEAGITGEALKEKRQKEAYPEIQKFERWMYATAMKVSQNSRVGKAISYTLPLLPRLSRYVNDGRFCIDNNLVENAIRPLALGRKNFLFCGNHDAAIVYSLIGSCKAAEVDPREWLEDILLKIPENGTDRSTLRELLPSRWAKKTD